MLSFVALGEGPDHPPPFPFFHTRRHHVAQTFFDADEAGDEEAAMESAARRLKHRGYVSSLVRERDVDSTATTAAGDDDDGDAADAEAPGEEN